MRRGKRQAGGLESTSEALENWRRQFGGPGRRIPEALWADAAEVARSRGVAETARALRLDLRSLAARVKPALATATAETAPAKFVEVGVVDMVAARDVWVVHFVARGGDHIRVDAPCGGGSVADLVELARAFWGRCP